MGKYIVGITGASGTVYAKKMIERLLSLGQNVEICLTDTAFEVSETELGWKIKKDITEEDLQKEFQKIFGCKDQIKAYRADHIGAAIASGSYSIDGMIILPCSMGMVSSIAVGASDNLIERAADVMLKEGKKLIIVPREAPLNTIHLKNLYELSTYGVKIIPACPSFYHNPKDIDELLDYFVGRILNQLEFDDLTFHWK